MKEGISGAPLQFRIDVGSHPLGHLNAFNSYSSSLFFCLLRMSCEVSPDVVCVVSRPLQGDLPGLTRQSRRYRAIRFEFDVTADYGYSKLNTTQEPNDYKTTHFLRSPSPLLLSPPVFAQTLQASSKTLSTPSPVIAEHSKYPFAPISRATWAPSSAVIGERPCVRIRDSSVGLCRVSILVPMRRSGVCGVKWDISGCHWKKGLVWVP
jgi:hypothetical protein